MKLLAIFIGASAVALAPATLVAQNTPAPEPAAQAEAPQSASAEGTVTPGPDRRFTGADLFDLATASDPQISPDGSQIAYVRQSNDVMSDSTRSAIWLVDARTGEEKPVAGQDGNAFSPRWSPSGNRLAFVSTNGGSAQLWVRWMDGGEAVRLTGLPTSPSSMAWSPDGRSIAYTMLVKDDAPKLGAAPENKPEGAQWAEPLQIYDLLTYRADGAGYLKPGFEKIFVIPADGGAPRQLTFGPSHDGGPLSWSRDGSTIYFGANRKADWQSDPVESEIYAVDLASGGISQLTDRDGPDHSPRVSPDGSRIAYLGYDDALRAYENDDLYVMDTDGSNRRILTESWDFSPSGIEWDADGRAIYAQYDVSGETRVARIGLDGSIRDVATGLSGGGLDRPYTGGSFSVAKTDAIASTGGPATRPAELRLTRGGDTRILTDLNRSLREVKTMGEVRKITTASSHDGIQIEGWLTLPPGYVEGQRVPLILEIHGGPFAAYGPHFASDNQLYAAAGYAVLSANPRGSTSYGEGFANEIDKAYPGNDYFDLISIVDEAIAQGIADPDALFVTGGSGGGVLTSWIVGKTNRFKAAATQKPVINWTTQVLTADSPAFFGSYWLGAQPWENPQLYWDRSPLSLVGNVETPTLVVVGSEDYRTPVSESEQYYTALRLRGVPTALVKVPGASHGSIAARPSQSAAKASAILAWFERYKDGWSPDN
ncbi:acyl-peptide hydrolase [Citromicrobium sp. RCC1885]|uniref:alpha/beta hydrolase family protein n=1 Tax=unclassified Citromicrobium TaxID=2630544 RepID=UPI0006C91D59|nr:MULTISPECIES: S9 family peptidase [unclassified Citromicrobium]KPM22602.1 acyl-peptide hydrolase [Citromicrobium sp. RCC1885]KPM26085.1 acyl-peptide hydrolase [Citromicrobium sp. RCC1878]OAM07826.1 acyl-peptide hydrolase [Citromicrobium sp. RCC1897]|tara:strand:+ start:12870 stop:15002 length:2133 start_codon:yes stop_codon:yes gene_type:complete